MGTIYATETTEFCLEGRFIDFVIKDGYKLKGLKLETSEGEFYVKLAKHLRAAFDLRLPKGTWLQVVGIKKYDNKKGEFTLKAERVMAARADLGRSSVSTALQEPPASNEPKPKPVKAKQTILVCQKSDCWKRGGKGVCQAFEAALSDRGLEDQVTIKGTGCMKNCKAGPNLVMPDKTRYSRIQASQVPALMDKHFVNNNEDKQSDTLEEVAINISNFNEVSAKFSPF
ncbi:(2Fe-2S) ferredoxin domain-containing protein [Nostoc sp. FACHB-152]|uniref:(2Fe-2S) ferredoxin domain-containing protein n=1 Tax=unclassified Nostoc TaxID=2593658 RepID=UPI0016821AA7|nr:MULTISPECIES: (2Fe-2S) ferredoxin domain-containing protein [unclassified Nostoc]MBD2446799.1 (2Fe-2S) ferredoxin domain-containing protein [Nostoc sp. FACHB-152]MBD2466646.1 (2Fe-2S) ferredoxin domain-containing protein [Nostoc sp. FACHB-145]